MRTIRISWKKAIPFGFVSLLILYFAAPIFLPTGMAGLGRLDGNKIHQGQEKPIFKEDWETTRRPKRNELVQEKWGNRIV